MVAKPYRIVIILLIICVGISLGLNGFLYVQTVDLRRESEELKEQISALSGQLDEVANTKNFTFELPNYAGLLVKIELTFKIVEENLSISAEVSDRQSGLIVVFDRDGNGTVAGDCGWIFGGGNISPNNYLEVYDIDPATGIYRIIHLAMKPSPYHKATSTANATYFDIMLPLSMLNLQNSLVYISDCASTGRGVVFDFGLEV